MIFSLPHILILSVYLLSFALLLGFVKSSGARRYGLENLDNIKVEKVKNFNLKMSLSIFFVLASAGYMLMHSHTLDFTVKCAIFVLLVFLVIPSSRKLND